MKSESQVVMRLLDSSNRTHNADLGRVPRRESR
jgi:hypothetical protein